MNTKLLSVLSYFTIIGWLISYFYSNSQNRDSLLKFHLNQSLGVFVCGIVFNILIYIVGMLVPSIASVLSVIGLVFIVLLILGIINATGEKEKPLPIIGSIFINRFSFIK